MHNSLRILALTVCALLTASCASIGIPQPTPTVAPTLTPSQTVARTTVADLPTRTALPTETDTEAPTLSATPEASATEEPSITPSLTASPTETQTPTNTETPTDTTTPTETVTPTNTTTPTSTPTATDTVLPTATPLPTIGPTNTPTPTNTSSLTPTPSITPSLSPTPSLTFTPEPTETFTPTVTFTPSDTLTPLPSSTQTATITASATLTLTTTPSIVASETFAPPSSTPTFRPSATATRDPFFVTPRATWTPILTPTPTSTQTITPPAGPPLDVSPVFVTLESSDPTPEQPLPTETTVPGDASEESFEPTATPTLAAPTVPPITPLPTITFIQLQGVPSVTIGALPFQIGPGLTGASFTVPGASSAYHPFSLPNPRRPNEAIVTDEFGTMYWVVNGERHGMPAPFTSFGPDSLENSDRLVRAAAWSPDGNKVAFVVDNPTRGGAEDGVWWWEVGTGRAYQVMHNCRRQVRNCKDFVDSPGDPYVNPPADEPEQPNTGWWAQSVSWSPTGDRLLARLRIRDDERLAFIVLPATADENYKKQRGDVCKYELSDWTADGQSVLVAGRNAQDEPVLGLIEEPLTCSGFASLESQVVDETRATPIPALSLNALPEGVVADSEFEPGQQLQVSSSTGGLNLRTLPTQGSDVRRYVLNGEYIRVIAGPINAENYRWWKVLTADGLEGWMAGFSGANPMLIPAP